MVITPHIHAWAAKSDRGVSLHLDRALAERHAAQQHGIVVELASSHALAVRLAREKIAEDLETYAAACRIEGERWWDTRPLLDTREQPQECIDMAVQALDYGISTGMLQQHPTMPHIVRMVL